MRSRRARLPLFIVLVALAAATIVPASAQATWSGTVSGSAGTFTHDSGSAEPLTIFASGGSLAHIGTNNAGFEGPADFDSSTAGVQAVPNSGTGSLSIVGGNLPDQVSLGTAGFPAGAIAAPIAVDGGNPNLDLLSIVDDGDPAGRNFTVAGSNVIIGFAPPITHQNVERLEIRSGDGDDILTVASGAPPVEDVRMSAGNDRVITAEGVGVGTVDGVQAGTGIDTLDYGPWTSAVSVVSDPVVPPGEVTAQATGTAGVTGFENFSGGTAGDQLVGNHLANRLEGGIGNDDLTGGAGADTMLGGGDDDRLRAQDGEADAMLDCGDGTADVADRDLASIDPNSILAGCETVNTTPGPPPPPPPPSGGGGDDDPPETSIDSGPKRKVKSKKKKAKVTWEFSSSESGAGFECSLDGEAFAACASPLTERVKKGEHEFAVRARDAAGNVDATPAEQSFKVKRKRKRPS